VDAHVVMPDPPCRMQLDITGTDEPTLGLVPARLARRTPAPRGPGWYRGDLHAHTIHSDAQWDVPDLVAFARMRRLDFATLSDHNTVSGLTQIDAAGTDDLLTMGGMELTTFWGHALVLGLRDWIDWRTQPGIRSMDQIAQEVTSRGGLFILAHPMSIGDPYCSGCDWQYSSMMPGSARVVEVWNGDWGSDANNEAGLELAYRWLNAGYRLALTTGTDNHGSHPEAMEYAFNVVYAQELSEQEILRAVRAGHASISAGPRLELSAVQGEQRAMMGDVLDPTPGETAHITAVWDDCPAGARLDWILNGNAQESFPAVESGTQTWTLSSGQAHWAMITLRAADGHMLALTNPIYLDGRA
jgi:hypothetical protein